MVAIDSVYIRGFRGFGDETTIHLGGKGLVLLGDNGSGKSSVVDAIEYALTGNAGTLRDHGQGVSMKRHGRHVRSTQPPVVRVTLAHGGRNAVVEPETTLEALDEPFRSYVRGARSGKFVLRRAKVLDLIETTDARRHDALQPFLDLDRFRAFERSIDAAVKLATGRREKLAAAVGPLRQMLQEHVGNEVVDVSVLAWVNTSLAVLSRAPLDGLDALATTAAELLAKADPTGPDDARARLLGKLGDALAVQPSPQAFTEVLQSVRQARAFDQLAEVPFENVLVDGGRWLARTSPATCPLCEHRIDANRVRARVEARLVEAHTALAARKVAAERLLAITEALRTHWAALRDAAKDWTVASPGVAWPLVAWQVRVAELGKHLKTEWRSVDTDSVQAQIQGLFEQPMTPTTVKDSIPTVTRSTLQQARDSLRSAATLVPKWRQVEHDLRAASRLVIRMERLLAHAVDARRTATRECLDVIGHDAHAIYDEFHPGEPHGNVRVDVTLRGRATASLSIDYLGQANEDPRALMSEGHLDTLGFALFFALRRQQRRAGRAFDLVVLDDVLGVVDVDHRLRIANWLMNTVARDHQVIVTTHSRQWWELLEQCQRQCGAHQRFTNRRIVKDDVDSDPRLVDLVTDAERLRVFQGDPADRARLAAIVLEGLLSHVRVLWALSIPARPGDRYTLGDIWPKFYKVTKGRCTAFRDRVGTHVVEINELSILRNHAIHPNEWTNVQEKEARRFASAVSGLFDGVRCPECKAIVILGGDNGAVRCPDNHLEGLCPPDPSDSS